MIGDLLIHIRLTGWFAAIITVWSTAAYIVKERREARNERLHLINMRRMNDEHQAIIREIYSQRTDDENEL